MSILNCSLLSLGCAFGFAPASNQTKLTALRALKIAQRRLRPEVRAKLLSVSSSRSDATLIPEAWRFVFMDAATSGNSRIVTVAAKTSSEHPDTIEAFSSAKMDSVASLVVIPQNKLLIDSTKALDEVRSASKLKGIQAVEYRLLQPRSGREPFWQLQFFTEGKEEPIASFQVGAKMGSIQLIGSDAAAA